MASYFEKGLLLLITLASPVLAFAADYSSGHQALQIWDDQAKANMPTWVFYWLISMASVFACGLFFIKRHVEARWLVGGFVLGLFFSRFAIPALGLVPLSGLVALVHLVFWSPALYLMLKNRPFIKVKGIYSIWSAMATFCICFSFVFDIRDAAIYLSHVLIG